MTEEIIDKIARDIWNVYATSPLADKYHYFVTWEEAKELAGSIKRLAWDQVVCLTHNQAVSAYHIMQEHPHNSADSGVSQD